MKIIQITPAYKPAYIYGGPTMSVAKLCEVLMRINDNSLTLMDKFNLEVLTTTANGKHELNVEVGKQINVDNVLVTYFERITKDHTHFSPRLLLALHKKIKIHKTNLKHQPTSAKIIVHIHSWWNLVAILSCLIAKINHIPVILSPRGMLTSYTQNNRNPFLKSALHNLLGKSLLKYCHIIASSEQEKQDILQIINPKSICIIPNLISLPSKNFSSTNKGRSNIKGAPFNLLFLSRIEEKKGLDLLFDALVSLNIEWKLSIAGEGKESYVQNLKFKAKSLKIDHKINWLGQVKNQDKFVLMAKSDLLVLTSHNENFANVVIESLSVGTPVLISEQVGLATYVNEKKLGFVTKLQVDCVINELRKAHKEISTRQRINMDAAKIISEDFNEEILILKYIDYYKQIN